MADHLRQPSTPTARETGSQPLAAAPTPTRLTDLLADDDRSPSLSNEEAAAFAAAAQAQLTGRLAVCAGSCGPGNTHLTQGLYDAHRSGAPVLALASHITSEQIGTGFFQETHPERLFLECSHFCELVSQPAQMPRLARIAIQTALEGRNSPCLPAPGISFRAAGPG